MSAAAGETAYDDTRAGGKFRRKPLRKSQATPYDRPPVAIRHTSSGGGGGNGWLSKIIDPASKLINASAHRLFGLAFRKRLLPPPQQQQMPPIAATQDASELNGVTESVPRSEIQFNVGDQSGTIHRTTEPVSLDNDGRKQDISELEKILAQKTFTESEINRLTALLNSRTVEDNGKIESIERAPKTIIEGGNCSELKSPLVLVPDNSYNATRYLGATATSSLFSNAKVMDNDIATPAELAKAYMGSRSSKVSPSMLGSRSQAIKKDLPLINSVIFPSQSPSMSSANKSLSRISAPKNGYMTPRLRGRSAIYNMSRTPYSRSEKGSDVRGVNGYDFQSPQLSLEASKISSSGQMALKRRSNVIDDDIGSAGPIRRIRQRSSLLSSQRSNEPDGGSSPTYGPGVLPKYRSKNVQSRTSDENFMSVPSQSSVVAQKILQHLDKLSPPPKKKSSEKKSVVMPEKVAFTLRSLEKAESSKIFESPQENSKVNDSAQRVATNEELTVFNGKNYLEDNGPQKPTSDSKSNSESVFNSWEHPLAKNKQAFQVSAHEDNNPKTMSDQNGTVPNGSIKQGKEDNISYSSGSLTNPIQPTAMDNASPPLFGKVPSDEQTTMTPYFRHRVPVADKFSPPTVTLSSISPTANDSQALQTSTLLGSRTSNSRASGLSDTFKTNPGDCEGALGVGAVDARPSQPSNGISTTPAFFPSKEFANSGFSNSSFTVQPASTSTQFSGASTHNISSSTTMASAASIPNAAPGITSSGVNLFSTSVAPFSTSLVFGSSSRKDTQVSSNVNGPPSDLVAEKPITALNSTTSNPFGIGGTSSTTANGSNVFSGFGSSMSCSPKLDNQGFGSVSNADSNQAKTITTAPESIPQNTLFKFGSSAPASVLPGSTNSTPANSMTSLQSPMFGQNSLPSLKEAGSLGSNGSSSNSLFGSNWNANNSPLFGSTTSSSTFPTSVFKFGASAALSAPVPSSSTPGSLFGSSSAAFSLTSAATSVSPSLFSASQPVMESSNPAFVFGSPTNLNSNNQTSTEDTMAEDTLQTAATSSSLFGQPQSSSNSVFTFGAPSPSVTPGTGVFQFGGLPSSADPLNQAPFQASGGFNTAGGFSEGKAGDDKSQRKIVKVKRNPKRR